MPAIGRRPPRRGRRRAILRQQASRIERELADLNVAERLYRDSITNDDIPIEHAADEQLAKYLDPSWAAHSFRPRSIKEMIQRVLFEVHPSRLSALEILEAIQRRWKPTLERTSLSPQLTRLKGALIIRNERGRWFLMPESDSAPPTTAGGAS